MKLLHKKIILILLICFVGYILSSCDNNVKETLSIAEPIKTKIKVLHGHTASANVIDNVFSEFNTLNPDIDVEIILLPSEKGDEFFNMLMASNDGPDVYSVGMEKISFLMQKGWIASLNDYISEDFLSKFPEDAIKRSNLPEYNGNFYSIAGIADTYRLIYNKDLFKKSGLDPEKPPRTLKELREYAKIITESGKNQGQYGFALPLAEEWAGYILGMEIPATFSGVSLFDFKNGRYDVAAYKPWLEAYLNIKNDGSIFPNEFSLKNDMTRAQFAEGNIGMMYAASFDPSVYEFQFPAKCDWDVAMPPALDEESIGKGKLRTTYSFAWAVNPKTKNMDKAMKVYLFCYSENMLGTLYKEGRVLPIVQGIIENDKYKPTLKNFEKFIPTKYDGAEPDIPKNPNNGGRDKDYAKILIQNQSIDEVLNEMNVRLNKPY